MIFNWFEKRLEPFPADDIAPPRAKSPDKPITLTAFCWYYVKDAAPWLILMAFLAALIGLGEVLLYGFMGQVVDWLANADRETFLREEKGKLTAMAATLLIGLPLIALFLSLIIHQTLLGNLPMSARWRMHRHLLGQSLKFFSDEFAGRISTKVMQTALAVREVVMKILNILVYISVYFLTMLTLFIQADWRLAIPLLVWLIAYGALIAYFIPRLANISERQADARSAMTGRIVDSYANITTVKLFSHSRQEEIYAKDSMEKFLGTVHPQMRLVTLFEVSVYTINMVLIFFIVAMGIALWLDSLITIGAIAAAIALVLRIEGISQWIMWEVSALFEHIGVIHDGMKMLNQEISVQDADNAKPIKTGTGAISFEGVSFHYGQTSGVIENLSLAIKAGEKIGLVGRSGAGKTTLTNLLLRFYDLEGGKICVDGQDISSIQQESLRARIGVVTQDTSLLHRSIRDNVAYGSPDAKDCDIMKALERANAKEFIVSLKDQKGRIGLEAHVGERGVKLSGGQRQRIALARLFLKNAPILVLDEATSALDSEVEMAIQENLFALMEGKTVIAIAHRLSTIAAMDRLVVMDGGKIIEQGRHDELVTQGGLYAGLWARQSGGFIDYDKISTQKTSFM